MAIIQAAGDWDAGEVLPIGMASGKRQREDLQHLASLQEKVLSPQEKVDIEQRRTEAAERRDALQAQAESNRQKASELEAKLARRRALEALEDRPATGEDQVHVATHGSSTPGTQSSTALHAASGDSDQKPARASTSLQPAERKDLLRAHSQWNKLLPRRADEQAQDTNKEESSRTAQPCDISRPIQQVAVTAAEPGGKVRLGRASIREGHAPSADTVLPARKEGQKVTAYIAKEREAAAEVSVTSVEDPFAQDPWTGQLAGQMPTEQHCCNLQ